MGNINATRTSELIHISARICPGRENLAIQRRCADPRTEDHIEEQRNADIQHNIKQHHEDKIILRRDYNMP